MYEREASLRRLSINDARFVDEILCADRSAMTEHPLDPRVRSLVRLGILVALSGPPSAFERTATEALANGATADELVDVLISAAPMVGSSHVVAAAPRLARALGYDLDAALEGLPAVAD
jgi:alkylhydroperoxidase/carboxymuconolactone decarboxylase family protein YurZ